MKRLTNTEAATINIEGITQHQLIGLEAANYKYVFTYDIARKRFSFANGSGAWDSVGIDSKSTSSEVVNVFLNRLISDNRCELYVFDGLVEFCEWLMK